MPVLMYHHVAPLPGAFVTVTPEAFEEHVRLLARRPTLFLDELVGFMEGRIEVPRGAVVLTFDDGYADFARWAFPLMEKYGVRGTVFICPGLMADSRGGSPVELASHRQIWASRAPEHFLTWEEALRMQAAGLVRFASHTLTHPRRMAELPSEAVREELLRAKEAIEERLGVPCLDVAWPGGSYSARTVEIAREVGYRSAYTTRRGPNRAGDDPMAIRRFPAVGDAAGLANRLKMRRRLFVWGHGPTAAVWGAVCAARERRHRRRRT